MIEIEVKRVQAWLSTYIEQTDEVRDLLERNDKEYSASPDMIGALRQRSARVFHLLCANNDLIREHLQPLLTNEYALSDDEYAMLTEAAQALCSLTEVTDACLALHIHQKLLDTAEARGDIDQIVRQSYDGGIAAMLLYKDFSLFTRLHVRRYVTPWFTKAASYLPMLSDLSPQTRGYVLRSLNNQALLFNPRDFSNVDEEMQILRHARTVFQDPAVRALMPELNWEAFMASVYRNMLFMTDTIEHGYGLDYLEDVKQAAEWLDALDEPEEDESVNDRYSQIELQNVLHLISDEECIRRLDAIYATRDPLAFTREEAERNVLAPAYSFVYEERIPNKNPQRVNDKLKQMVTYINAYHSATGDHVISGDAVNLIRNYPHMKDVRLFRDVLVSIFRAVHLPTCIHSRMVARLAQTIAEALLDASPAYFVGFLGIADGAEARARRAELLSFIRYAGLLHDVGKFFCMSVITQYARRLFDDEFDIIKLHSVCGYEVLQAYASTAPFAEVALMHHITYDRKGGYAMDFIPEKEASAAITDIIHIADAMDAATDSVGRCYTQCKMLSQLMEELVTRPNQYHPDIVAVISAPRIVTQLENILDTERIQIYKQAYDHA